MPFSLKNNNSFNIVEVRQFTTQKDRWALQHLWQHQWKTAESQDQFWLCFKGFDHFQK